MRALAALTLALLAGLVMATTASADHHLMRVTELQLSNGGNTNQQFVELTDSVNEPFPATYNPYGLAVFDGNGMLVGSQSIDHSFFQARGETTTPILIASAAYPTSGELTLTTTLPQGAGQVCFTASGGAERVHCMAYGCPAVRLTSTGGSQAGAAPPNDRSLQRTASGLGIGTPTPGGQNGSSTPTSCPSPGGSTGTGGGGGGGGGGAVDKTRPKVTTSIKKRQDIDKLSVSVKLSERAKLTVSGTVAVPGSSATLRFKTVRKTLAAGAKKKIRLKLSHARLKKVKRALAKGHKLKAKLKLQAKDAAGNKSLAKRLSVKLTN
jgi:hypothetical protein